MRKEWNLIAYRGTKNIIYLKQEDSLDTLNYGSEINITSRGRRQRSSSFCRSNFDVDDD
jgi:hypothetical protein